MMEGFKLNIPVYFEGFNVGQITHVVDQQDLLDQALQIVHKVHGFSTIAPDRVITVSVYGTTDNSLPSRTVGAFSTMSGFWSQFSRLILNKPSYRTRLIDRYAITTNQKPDICEGRPITDNLSDLPLNILVGVIDRIVVTITYQNNL